MTEAAGTALRELRETLRSAIPDTDTFTFSLSAALQAIHLHPTSVPPSPVPEEVLRAIDRYIPAIQISLLNQAVPTFLHALDDGERRLVESFFCPKRDATTLPIARSVALATYQTIPPLLSSSHLTPLPTQSRDFAMNMLAAVVDTYSIDDLYWAIWGAQAQAETSSSGEKMDGVRTLRWEETVKALVTVPAKAANAVGRWKQEGWAGDVSQTLQPKPFFDWLVLRLEALMYEISQSSRSKDTAPIRFVYQRLASLGLFSQRPTSLHSPSPSILPALLPRLLSHLHTPLDSPIPPYPASFLPSIFLPLPSSTLASVTASLLQHLVYHLSAPSAPILPDRPDSRVKRSVDVLARIIGAPEVGGEAWDAVIIAMINGKRNGSAMDEREHALTRMAVAWVGTGGEKAANAFIDVIMEAWTDPKYIKFALYGQQFHLTHLLILALSLLPPYHSRLVSLSHRPRFLHALQSYLAHPDASIRRLGMLVAETVSEMTIPDEPESSVAGKDDEIEELKAGLDIDEETGETRARKPRSGGARRLRFGKEIWDGAGQGRDEARWLRSSICVRDGEAVLEDDPEGNLWLLGWDEVAKTERLLQSNPTPPSFVPRGRTSSPKRPAKPKSQSEIVMLTDEQMDDPLEGYTNPSPSSSRSPSPTPSHLEEIASDPSLALDGAQKKKVTRPVYVGQLAALLKERDSPEHLEMALKWGESLVRAKRSFGTELAENAVTVATLSIGLNDPFHLDEFDKLRQGLVTALVACAPRQVAPFLTEQYFNSQYSLQQKSVMLTALAMGARELAGMKVPEPQATRRIDFPSKTLPPALHKKYVGPSDLPPALGGRQPDQLEQAIDGVRGLLISKSAKRGEDEYPELAREKRLRVGPNRRTMVAEQGSLAARQADERAAQPHASVVPFAEVAAEYFIMPLINRFWQHFQDIGIRESRAVVAGNRFRGAGAGMVMSPMALEKLLMTLSLMLHAARHSPVFLAVLSPEALELGMTIGLRHPNKPEDHLIEPESGESGGEAPRAEAQVLGAALELTLVALDGAAELDQGRTLAMDKPELVLAIGEWASGVFDVESKGGMVAAGQGGREGRIRAGAAAVVVKVAEIGEKWGHLGLPRMR